MKYLDGMDVGFDHVSLYDVNTGDTIMDDALDNKYTYDQILKTAEKWYKNHKMYKENKSAEVNEKFREGQFIKSKVDSDKFSGDVYDVTNDVDGSGIDKGMTFRVGSVGRDEAIIFGADDEVEYSIDPKDLKHFIKESEVNEGFSSKSDFNKIRKALSQGKTVTAQHARFPMSITIKEIDPKGMYATVDFNDGQGDSEMAAMNIDPRTIKITEAEVNEAKKFKPGDMWSNDFDYDGMLKYALKVNEKTPIKTLNALFDSATDVNYHTPFRNLGIAIDWIEDGDVKGAKDYIKMFHKDIKNEIKNQS